MVVSIKVFINKFDVTQFALHYSFGVMFCFVKKFLCSIAKYMLIFNKVIA